MVTQKEKYPSLYLCYNNNEMVFSKTHPGYVCPMWVWDPQCIAEFIRIGFINIFCKLVDGSTVMTSIPFLIDSDDFHADMEYIAKQIKNIENISLAWRIYNLKNNEVDMVCLDDILPKYKSSYDVVGYEIKELRVIDSVT